MFFAALGVVVALSGGAVAAAAQETSVANQQVGMPREFAVEIELLFAPGAARLEAPARARLDQLAGRLPPDPRAYRLVLRSLALEGNLDVGDFRLAQRRLAAVRKYLHRENGIPLERIGLFGVPEEEEAAAGGAGEAPLLVMVQLP